MKIQGNLQVTGKGANLTVEEIDGSPAVEHVSRLRFTNGSVTDNGDGSVSIDLDSGSQDIFSFSMETVALTNQYIEAAAPHGISIQDVKIVCKSGSCTGAFYIVSSGDNKNGISVGGLDPIAVTTTLQTVTPTGASTLNAGDALLFSIQANSSAKHLRFTLTGNKT